MHKMNKRIYWYEIKAGKRRGMRCLSPLSGQKKWNRIVCQQFVRRTEEIHISRIVRVRPRKSCEQKRTETYINLLTFSQFEHVSGISLLLLHFRLPSCWRPPFTFQHFVKVSPKPISVVCVCVCASKFHTLQFHVHYISALLFLIQRINFVG